MPILVGPSIATTGGRVARTYSTERSLDPCGSMKQDIHRHEQKQFRRVGQYHEQNGYGMYAVGAILPARSSDRSGINARLKASLDLWRAKKFCLSCRDE